MIKYLQYEFTIVDTAKLISEIFQSSLSLWIKFFRQQGFYKFRVFASDFAIKNAQKMHQKTLKHDKKSLSITRKSASNYDRKLNKGCIKNPKIMMLLQSPALIGILLSFSD